MRKLQPLLGLLLLASVVSQPPANAEEAPAQRPAYSVLYTAWIKAGEPVATVRVRLGRNSHWVRWMRLNIRSEQYSDFKGSGEIRIEDGQVHWQPPAEDAWLQYKVRLESKRESGRYDGIVERDWAMFRADDLVPPVHLDMKDGTQSQAKLRLNLPEGWSAETPFPRYSSGRYRIDNPQRLFDRPTGWILLGDIGTRRETIGSTRFAVAAPANQGARRMDMLAFLRWTVPTLQTLFEDFPARLLVISAADPMWRGALSAPDSLYVHAERPLISENATSTVLHELVHVAMSARGAPGADWIVEGLAEYYSLETLLRSGTISRKRYDSAHAGLLKWAASAPTLAVPRSSGAVTAKAVVQLRAIDGDIRRYSAGERSLDDVVRQLARDSKPISVERFRELAEAAAGRALDSVPR